MNLNLSPNQFLAMYGMVLKECSPEAIELRIKMEAVLLDALSMIDDAKNQDKFVHWIKKEEEKVSALATDLKSIKVIDPTAKSKTKPRK